MNNKEIGFLVVICDRKERNELLDALYKKNVAVLHRYYGKGFTDHEENILSKSFGLVNEKKKVILIGLINNSVADEIISMLNEVYNFKESGTGIAFTIPVNRLAF